MDTLCLVDKQIIKHQKSKKNMSQSLCYLRDAIENCQNVCCGFSNCIPNCANQIVEYAL